MEPKSAADERKQLEGGEGGGCKTLKWDLNLHCAYGVIVLALSTLVHVPHFKLQRKSDVGSVYLRAFSDLSVT